ncbi:hypothetical protein V6C27_09270 [Peptococcaceae bacterium 1198_IL3148]
MTLINALEIFKSAGVRVLPIPGTSKFNLTLPGGKVAIIKREQLMGLAAKLGSNPDDLQDALLRAI